MAELNYFCKFPNFNLCNNFSLYEIGTQKCPPLHDFGPIIRPHYIFHYVHSGKGYLLINNVRFDIGAMQGFLIPSNVLAYYQADEKDPWNYSWIHIDGPLVKTMFERASLNSETPIFHPVNYHTVEAIFQDLVLNYQNECYCVGKIYEFFSCLTASDNYKEPEMSSKLQYVHTITNYIQIKYCEDIHVSSIAQECGLNRSYMTRLFKEATNYTIQEYLLHYRMKMACQLLQQNIYPIQHVAYAVGYTDAFTFSKAFKRYVHCSPTEYKHLHPADAEALNV